MAPGRFTVELERGAPERVKALSDDGFMQIIVTSVRVDCDAISAADLVAIARYRGVYRRRSEDRCRWEGAGLAVLLGDEDGKANTYIEDSDPTARPLYDGSNTSVIRNLVLRNGSGGANGITVGSGTASSATPTKALKISEGDSLRDVLNLACEVFTSSGSNPYEWLVDAAGALHVALRNTLFPTVLAPTALASRRTDGFGVAGTTDLIPVTRIDQVDDWESFMTTVTVAYTPKDYAFGVAYVANDTVVATSGIYYECILGHTSSGSNYPPNATYWQVANPYGTAVLSPVPYPDLAGSDLLMREVGSSRGARHLDDASAVAARRLGRHDDMERRPSISTDLYDVGAVCRPGDGVWVFDPDTSLVSLGTQVDVGSGVAFPVVVRVQGMEWPVRDGMGVYAYVAGGSPVDVTDYVVFGEGDARLDVGAPRRLLNLPRFKAA